MDKKENERVGSSIGKKLSASFQGLNAWIRRLEHRKNFTYDSVAQAYVFRPKMWIPNLITVVVMLALFIWFIVDSDFGVGTSPANGSRLAEIFGGIFKPNFSYIFGFGGYSWESSAIYQSIQTFSIAFVGTLIGSILSIPFGFLASRKMVGRWSLISEIILIFIRTIPEIILGYVMIRGFGFSSLAGVMVLGFHSIGMIGKLYSEQLDEIDFQPIQALSACGGGFAAKLKYGIVPSVAPNFLSVILYRFDLNLRTASLLGLVAGDEAGLGSFIQKLSANGHWPEFGGALWCLIIMILVVDLISTWLRKKLV